MEKKNRVTANPYRERAKLEPKKAIASCSFAANRWSMARTGVGSTVNPSATAANQRCILEQHRALPYMRKC